MKTGRPKIKVPLQGFDIVMDMLSATVLLLMIIYTLLSYSELPETIPSHFNAKGEVDGYSSRISIWLLPAIGLVFYIGMLILNKYPHIHNYMVNITEENALKNYRFSTRIVRVTNFFMMITFGIIVFGMINSAQNSNSSIENWILPFIIGFSILLPIGIFIYQKQINK